jgi:DNA-directed RNA polymerase alpha subunit
MNPVLSQISEESDIYKFTISGVNVSVVNAIRRTILSDIPTLAFYTETHDENQCTIHANTTRLHNEIIKHRLSCIPIHETDLTLLPNKYVLELDIQNDTDEMMIVTTENFRIRNKTNDKYLTAEETRRIFPPCAKTNAFIDFARLRPRIDDSIPGERLALTAEFSVRTAKDNSMFNVVSKCSYGNTIDAAKSAAVWEAQEDQLRAAETPAADIEFQKRNFYLLDAQRHYVDHSYDFVIQTVGVFENRDLLKKACVIIRTTLAKMVDDIDSNLIPVIKSDTTDETFHDTVLENIDYTIGNVVCDILCDIFESDYKNEEYFCAFNKHHPHDTESVIRMGSESVNDKETVRQLLRRACVAADDIFKNLHSMF